jgi:hypothetical protein
MYLLSEVLTRLSHQTLLPLAGDQLANILRHSNRLVLASSDMDTWSSWSGIEFVKWNFKRPLFCPCLLRADFQS